MSKEEQLESIFDILDRREVDIMILKSSKSVAQYNSYYNDNPYWQLSAFEYAVLKERFNKWKSKTTTYI